MGATPLSSFRTHQHSAGKFKTLVLSWEKLTSNSGCVYLGIMINDFQKPVIRCTIPKDQEFPSELVPLLAWNTTHNFALETS